VHVRVFRIMNFKDTAGFMDKTDPYVQLQYGTTLHKTTAKNNAGGNAVFNEVFSFVRNPSENQLKVAVFDSDTLIDDLLGLTTIDLRSGRDVPADIPRGTRWDILRPRDSVEELRNMQEGQSYDVLDKQTGKVQGQVVLAFAVSVPPPPPPPEKAVHGLASHFAPKVTLLGGFVEGETVTAMIIFPDLPPRSPPVRMRFVTQWQREDVGTYWLTHGEAMARAKLRQRGHYEAVGEQAFFIPAIDAEPLDAKRFLPIGGEETTADGAVIKRQVVNTLQYECTRRDIGCRLRFTCQPVDLYGHVGRVVQAVTPHILCPFPRIRSMCVRDVQTGLTVATSRIRAAAAEMYLDAEMLNAPVKTHSLHVVANYVGGDEGATIVKWYRMKRIDPTGRGNSDSDFREIIISEQVNPPPHPRPLLPPAPLCLCCTCPCTVDLIQPSLCSRASTQLPTQTSAVSSASRSRQCGLMAPWATPPRYSRLAAAIPAHTAGNQVVCIVGISPGGTLNNL